MKFSIPLLLTTSVAAGPVTVVSTTGLNGYVTPVVTAPVSHPVVYHSPVVTHSVVTNPVVTHPVV